MKHEHEQDPLRIADLASSPLLSSAASADLVIYEPFDYANTSPTSDTAFLGDTNQAGGLGLAEWP